MGREGQETRGTALAALIWHALIWHAHSQHTPTLARNHATTRTCTQTHTRHTPHATQRRLTANATTTALPPHHLLYTTQAIPFTFCPVFFFLYFTDNKRKRSHKTKKDYVCACTHRKKNANRKNNLLLLYSTDCGCYIFEECYFYGKKNEQNTSESLIACILLSTRAIAAS